LAWAGEALLAEQGARSLEPKGKDISGIVKLVDPVWTSGFAVIVNAPAIQQQKLTMKMINLTAVKIPI